MIRACLFDLDGTLLDTVTTIAYYGNLALAEFSLPTIETEKYKYLAGNGAKVLVERMLCEVGAYNDEMFDEVYNYYTKKYNENVSYLTKPYDGIITMLSALKKHNILIGIVSNKPDFATCNVSKQFFEEGLVDVVRGQRDGVAIKPAPDSALDVMRELGVNKDETAFIGDTWVDIETGKNLGVFTIGVLWGFRDYDELKSSGADLIVKTPCEITEYIDMVHNVKE